MALFLLFVLFFVGLIVCGILVSVYLYANGALHEGKIRWGRRPALGVASFSQTATMSTPDAASDLYYGGIGVPNEDRASVYVRRFILYSLVGILVALVVLTMLVLGALQF